MLCLFVLVPAALNIVVASPIWSDTNDLDPSPTDTDSFVTNSFDLADTSNLHASPGLQECDASDTNSSLQRRQTCAAFKNPFAWRAPKIAPDPVPSSKRTPKPVGSDPFEICDSASEKPLLLTCAGPEVWYRGRIGYVLNCIFGGIGTEWKIARAC